jgi:hypothetical protein
MASLIRTYTWHSFWVIMTNVKPDEGCMLKSFGIVFLVVVLFSLACTAAPSPTSTQTPTSGITPTSIAAKPTPIPTPEAAFPGFNPRLAEGTFWEYRWVRKSSSCAQGSGCSSSEKEGRFRITLGTPKLIKGETAYSILVSGLSQAGEDRDFAPRSEYLSFSNGRLQGSSDGVRLVALFDSIAGIWAGSGSFADRFQGNELVSARAWTITPESATAQWPNAVQGPALVVGRADSQSQCRVIEGRRICPSEQSYNITEQELYHADLGPVGYHYNSSHSSSGGGFFTSFATTETVGLVASSLRGDTASYGLEEEPNGTVGTAQDLQIPSAIIADTGPRDAWNEPLELLYHDPDQDQWISVMMTDVYSLTLSETNSVTISLQVEETEGAGKLGLLLFAPYATRGVSNVTIGGEDAELVAIQSIDLSAGAEAELDLSLGPGKYYVAVNAAMAGGTFEYLLSIE